MSSLTACVQVAPNTFLSSYSTSSAGGNVSTTATVQCGSGSYTYLWSFTGITVSITNGSTATPTFTYTTPGTTTCSCAVTDTVTSIKTKTNDFVITWTAPSSPITAMSFLLNGASFTTTQNRAAGTAYTISVGAVTPAAATYSPSSAGPYSTSGGYSLSSSGTGIYTGTFTSSVLNITSISVSTTPITGTQSSGSASLTNGSVSALTYAWVRVSGTGCTFSSGGTVPNPTITETGTTISTTLVQCTITFTGGSVVGQTTIQWGIV